MNHPKPMFQISGVHCSGPQCAKGWLGLSLVTAFPDLGRLLLTASWLVHADSARELVSSFVIVYTPSALNTNPYTHGAIVQVSK